MPIKKSAIKALKKSNKRALANTKVKSDLIALTRRLRKAVAAKDASKAQEWLKQLIKKTDKAVQGGVIKKNNGARRKSRLTKVVNALLKK